MDICRFARRTTILVRLATAFVAVAFAPSVMAQVALTMSKSFNPSTVQLGGNSTTTMRLCRPSWYSGSIRLRVSCSLRSG